MTRQQQRGIVLGISVGIVLAFLGWLLIRPAMFAGSPSPAGAPVNEEQRLHDMALRDLKETQDEVARMKAHGIGMHSNPDGKPGS
jgi:hypothetical protein